MYGGGRVSTIDGGLGERDIGSLMGLVSSLKLVERLEAERGAGVPGTIGRVDMNTEEEDRGASLSLSSSVRSTPL
jgi:hypothetical protein